MNELICTIWQRPENRRLIDLSMCGITYPDKRYSIRRPHSPIACIEYVISGCGVIHADDQTHNVQAGDAYFLQPGQDQYYYADAADPWKKIFLNLSGPLLDRLIEGYQLSNRDYYPALDIQEELNGILTLTQEQSGDNTAELLCLVTRISQNASSADPPHRQRCLPHQRNSGSKRGGQIRFCRSMCTGFAVTKSQHTFIPQGIRFDAVCLFYPQKDRSGKISSAQHASAHQSHRARSVVCRRILFFKCIQAENRGLSPFLPQQKTSS